jgi:hypothetical protein
MLVKKTTYNELNHILVLAGDFSEEKLPLSTKLYITRVQKKLIPMLEPLQNILTEASGEDEESIKKRVEAWNSPLEVQFEEIDITPIANICTEKNYGFLLDFLSDSE